MNDFAFKLTPSYCLYNGVAVASQNGATITFLMENPNNAVLKERLKKAFDNHLSFARKIKSCPEEYRRLANINFQKGDKNQLRKCISTLYEKENQSCSADGNSKSVEDFKNEAAAVLLLDSILNEAKTQGATDVHIEADCVRFRIAGRLVKELEIEIEKSRELVQRIKLLSGMNVFEKRKSQDGHFSYGNESPLFVRVSTMSVISKRLNSSEESVVLRILDTSRIPLQLQFLGFNLLQITQLKSMIFRTSGLIVICGPTGSGKSTSSAAILLEIARKFNQSLKIISLENPPEYIIPGVTQIKIEENNENSYQKTLSYIFRQDPDVIMIGEIRDEESCQTAIRASLTGHLVITTLHTDSVAGSFFRLENFGIQRKVLASVLRGVVVQNINFFDGTANLVADVAVPNANFEKKICDSKNDFEIEELFTHTTNVNQVLEKTIGRINKKDSFKNDKIENHKILQRFIFHNHKKNLKKSAKGIA